MITILPCLFAVLVISFNFNLNFSSPWILSQTRCCSHRSHPGSHPLYEIRASTRNYLMLRNFAYFKLAGNFCFAKLHILCMDTEHFARLAEEKQILRNRCLVFMRRIVKKYQ